MRLNQPLHPQPAPLDAGYLRHTLMRAAYLNKRDKNNAIKLIVALRKGTKRKVERRAHEWGVSMQVVVTVAVELLDLVSDGVDLWANDKPQAALPRSEDC